MKLPPFRAAAALTAALTAALSAAFSPALVSAQTYEYKLLKLGLVASEAAKASPALQLSTSAIHFGDVATNTTETRQVLVSNTGTGALSFTAAPTVTGAAAFSAGLTTCGATLAAGADCLAEATFSPTSTGPFNGVLTLTSALASSPHEVSLVGTAFNPVSLTAATLPAGMVGQAYSYDFKQLLSVSNETSPDKALAAWSSSGTLPAGLSFDTGTGVLSGTPVAADSRTDIDVTAAYRNNHATLRFSLVVQPLTSVVMHGSGYRVWSDGEAAESCLGYIQPKIGYAYAGTVGDGLYRVKPAGQAEATVYCDMTRDGGGWTLVARAKTNSMAHKNIAAVGSLNSPSQTAVAKLSDSHINALTTSMYLLRLDTYGTKVFFKADKPFIANSSANANLPAKLNLGDTWTPALAEPETAHVGLNTWSTTLGRYQLTKAGSAIGEGAIYTHGVCSTCYGFAGGTSSVGFGWAGPGDSGTMWVK